MKIKRIIEQEADRIMLSIDDPSKVSISVDSNGKWRTDFIDLKLTDTDLKISQDFCNMLRRKVLEEYAK